MIGSRDYSLRPLPSVPAPPHAVIHCARLSRNSSRSCSASCACVMGSPRRRLPGGSATTSLSSPSTKAASGARHGLPSNDKKFGIPDGILLTYQDKSALLLLIGACSKFLIPHSKEKGTLTKEQMGVPRPSVGSGS